MKLKINMMIAIGVLLFLLLLLFGPYMAQAADLKFSWTPNEIEPEGYRIHWGAQSRTYTESINVAPDALVGDSIVGTVTGIPSGVTYFYAATAYLGTDESDYSVEVEYTVPFPTPIAPTNFILDLVIE